MDLNKTTPLIPNQTVMLVDSDSRSQRDWFRFFNNLKIAAQNFIKPPVQLPTTNTSPLVPNSNNFVLFGATAQSSNLTISADVGNPTDAQIMWFRFKDDGTPRNLTWTTGTAKSYRVIGTTLPTVTVASKTVYIQCIFNANANRWDVISVAQEV